MKKEKRPPFTEEEKKYVYEKVKNAKASGLDVGAVMYALADELNSSYHTIRTMFSRMQRIEKRKEQDKQLQLTLASEEVAVGGGVVELEETQDSKASENSLNSLPSSHVNIMEEASPIDLVKAQTNVLLDRIEKLARERNEWKQKYEKLYAETEQLRNFFKVIEILRGGNLFENK